MENIYKCPKCGETENFHYNYDYSKAHRPVVDILCNNCGEMFPPALKLPKETPKQETTLEEAAEKYSEGNDLEYAYVQEIPAFIAGAKWQAEKMYSEEEVIAFTQWMYDYKGDINKVEELLKQFKKK
jgi:hypothetical protein